MKQPVTKAELYALGEYMRENNEPYISEVLQVKKHNNAAHYAITAWGEEKEEFWNKIDKLSGRELLTAKVQYVINLSEKLTT